MFLFFAFIVMTGLVACVAGVARALVSHAVGLSPRSVDVGIGPLVAAVCVGPTCYQFRALPLWTRSRPQMSGRPQERWPAYERASIAKRLLVDATRPAFGILFAALSMWIYFAAVNFPFDSVEIVQVTAGSPAAKAGLRTGDVIVTSTDFEFAGARRFVAAIQTSTKFPLRLPIKRGDRMITAVVEPEVRLGQPAIGVAYWMRPGTPRPLGPVGAVAPALAFVEDAMRALITFPAQLWLGRSTRPTLWTEIFVALVPSGYLGLVAWVLAALSGVFVAMINLVPLPTMRLDGSRIVLSLLSVATGHTDRELFGSVRAKYAVFATGVGLLALYQAATTG